MRAIGNFWQDESGADALEYGLLIAFIALVIMSAVTSLGKAISNMFAIEINAIRAAS
jgi:pilus assembly protein Flp/PilA